MDHGAVCQHRLGAHTGAIGREVRQLQLRAVAAAELQITRLQQRVHHLQGAGLQVRPNDFAKAAKCHHLAQIAQADRSESVALPRKGEDRVWPHRHVTTDNASQVHAEERQLRVGDGVDQVIDDPVLVGPQPVVLPPEWHDAEIDVDAAQPRDPVRLKPGRGDNVPGPDAILSDVERHARGGLLDVGHLARRENRAATLGDDTGHRLGDLRVVDDPSGLDEETAQTTNPRFAPGDLRFVKTLDVDAVGAGAFIERLHARQLGWFGGYEELAALLIVDALIAAEPRRRLHALAAELGFETSRLVIDTGVDDPAVAPGLVTRQRGLLLQHRDGDPREPLRHLHRRGEADDAPANHRQIEISHSPTTLDTARRLLRTTLQRVT